MWHVYFLKSVKWPHKTYIGYTAEVPEARLAGHNKGNTPFTAQYKPWEIAAYVAFPTKEQAQAYEKYAKSGSGKAYTNRIFFNK